MTRKQSALICADVNGFSRLMSRNDVEAERTINRYRQVMAWQVEQHHGRVVDIAGESILAAFNSAREAVNSGLAMQEALWARNRWLLRRIACASGWG